MNELLLIQHEKTNWSISSSEITCSMKQCRHMTPLCCVGTVGLDGVAAL